MPGDCSKTLDNVEAAINSPELNGNIVRALGEVVGAGRRAGGASPPESFQVYISEYIRFWNNDTEGCDSVSWNQWGDSVKLTRDLRTRMNDLTDQLNAKVKDIVGQMASLGVIWVEGIQDAYNGHRFCEADDSADYNKAPTGAKTWFWSIASKGYGDGSEGEGDASNLNDLANGIVSKLIPGPLQGLVNDALPPWLLTSAFNSMEDVQNALNALPGDDVRELSDSTYRIFHPKGTAYGAHAAAFQAAIQNNRGSPPRFDPGQCGFHLRQEYRPYPQTGPDQNPSYIRLLRLVDANGHELKRYDEYKIPVDGVSLSVTSALPYTLELKGINFDWGKQGYKQNLYKFSFAYGQYGWSVDDQNQNAPAHCKVGDVSSIPHDKNEYWSQDMDCVFPCSAPT